MQLTNRILCGLILSACVLMAQADPPGRVARLSYVYGAVSYRPAGVDDWASGRLQPARSPPETRCLWNSPVRRNCKSAVPRCE